MKELKSKIVKEIREKEKDLGLIGSALEMKKVEKIELDERYSYELKGNELYISNEKECATNKVYVENLGKVFDLKKLEKAQGTYEYRGKMLWLIQDSYPSDLCGHEKEYTAVAIDIKGNMYCITWDIINFETKNLEDTCNWNNYTVKPI